MRAQLLFGEEQGHDGCLALIRRFELVKMRGRQHIPTSRSVLPFNLATGSESFKDLPSRRIALEIFAFAFEESGTDLLRRDMVLSWVMNLLCGSQGNRWIDELIIASHEVDPFLVFRHGDWALAKFSGDVVSIVGLSLKDTSICIVRLLNFSHND